MKNFETISFDGLADLKNKILRLDIAQEIPQIDIPGKGLTKEYKAIWNTTKNRLATVATDGYTLVQHKEVFEPFVEILNKMNLSISGRIDNYGEAVYLTAWFNGLDKIKDDADGIMRGIRLVNSFDNYTAIRGELWGMRLVCSNGMKIPGFEAVVKRLHVGDVDVQKFVESFVNRVIEGNEHMQNLVSESMKETVEWKLAETLFKKMFQTKKHRETLLEELRAIYGEKESVNRWDIYNVVTKYATHGKEKVLSVAVQDELQRHAGKLLQKEVQTLVAEIPR